MTSKALQARQRAITDAIEFVNLLGAAATVAARTKITEADAISLFRALIRARKTGLDLKPHLRLVQKRARQ